MAEIGATLREARMHARVDLSEIEARTKIRAKYLRALENEEWSLLPGPTFTRSFLRTYADALGLDGKALVEEYRLHHERPTDGERFEHAQQPLVPTPSRGGSRGGAPRAHQSERPSGRGSRAYMVLVGAIVLLIVVLSAALIAGNGGSGKPKTASSSKQRHKPGASKSHDVLARKPAVTAPNPLKLTLELTATAPVWVCLVGEAGHEVIPGVTLEPGETVVHHAKRSFQITLGNSELQLKINGRTQTIAPAAEPVGYTITPSGLAPLAPGPECP